MIKPTVGRVVWFTPKRSLTKSTFGGIREYDGQPMAATIAYVWTDHMVNLQVIDHDGTAHAKGSVPLIQDGEPKPDGFFCEWMPYQKGQAAKTEQLEMAATESAP
jgi:uncharacterized protein (DUF1501 family)